jgi:ADP-heptose:LPS heptosyltransferase
MRLAVFKTNYLGDNVVFLPVVQELRRRFPDWRITLLTAPSVAALYQADIESDELLEITPDELKRSWRRPWRFARWWRELQRRRLAASLVGYDQSSAAHALAFLAGGRIRVGGAGLRIRLQGTLTSAVSWREGWSIAQWNWEIARKLVEQLGHREWPVAPPPPDLHHLAAESVRRRDRVVIHAGSKWQYTRWPAARFAELARRLAADFEVCWINAPEVSGVSPPPPVRCLTSTNLSTLAQILNSAALFVGNNSGPMHVANALGTPLVAITGPTDFTWDPEWHHEKVTVLRSNGLACQPCDRVQHAPGRCLNAAEPLACLERWSVDAIEAICRAKLNPLERVRR